MTAHDSDTAAAMRAEVQRLVGPHEPVLALFPTVRAAPGTPEPSQLRTMPTTGGPLRVAGRGLWHLAGESERLAGNAMGRVLHGKGLHGGGGSQAADLIRGLFPHGAPMAVTDRRVLLLRGRGNLGTTGLEIIWTAPRDQLRQARAAARGMVQRGRVELGFADDSWVAVVTVPVRDSAALADALNRR